PKAIGVGQYQHDVDQYRLARALDARVEDCVNRGGRVREHRFGCTVVAGNPRRSVSASTSTMWISTAWRARWMPAWRTA
ncbi:hypothetical protein C7E18_23295, partial [Stenotrophomonas maltophilia]